MGRSWEAATDDGRAFIREAIACEDERHESVGLGFDHGCSGKGVVGSALVHEDKVIHAAFFRAGEDDKGGRMSSATSRRRFRL